MENKTNAAPTVNLQGIRERMEALTSEMVALHDVAFLLSKQPGERIEVCFRNEVLLPLKSVVAMAENIEEKIYGSACGRGWAGL